MIFAIPMAVKGASLAVKVLIVVSIVLTLLGFGFFGGKHWEKTNTLEVQAEFDKFKSEVKEAGDKQNTATSLENQRLKNQVEKANEETIRSRANTQFYADELRKLAKASSRSSVMPGPLLSDSGTESSNLTCFDGAELIAADERYRAGEADRRERIHQIVEKGAKETDDLNSAKRGIQSLLIKKEITN